MARRPYLNPSRQRAVLFAGPSLAGQVLAELFPPDVSVRGPVRRGDMDDLPASVTDVLIVDGVFHSTLAVSAREILAALRRGVRVYGSSSMGALRAAELDRFGMVGVGGVYEMYRSGEVVSDAEVAVVFDGDSLVPLSEPLVNLRYSLRLGMNGGFLTRDSADTILRVAASFWYADLTYDRLFDALGGLLPVATWRAWRDQVQAHPQECNLKLKDAIELAQHYREARDALAS